MGIDNPMMQLVVARQNARKLGDESSKYCTMSSLDPDNQNQVRMRTLVVRDVNDTSCLLYLNRSSKKNLASIDNNQLELLFFYPSLMSQYRVRGSLCLMTPEELEPHWQHKPYISKLLDHYYLSEPQSSTVKDRPALEHKIEALKLKYPVQDSVPFPEGALGLRLVADYVECWIGQDDGLHDRRLYQLSKQGWTISTLVP